MKLSKQILSTVMALVFALSVFTCFGATSIDAAAKPVFTVNKVSSLTYNNAKISASITNPAKTKITRVGFVMGTTKGKNYNINKYDKVNMKDAKISASFLMSKYKVTLKENTTYYYKFYMITGGTTYYSGENNFKTPKSTPEFSVKKVTNLKYNNAQISASITNPKKTKITRVGFIMGTTKGKNYNINKYDNVNLTDASVNATYLMSKYKVTLKEKTTYYYKFYFTTGGKTYYSGENNFTTPKKGSTETFNKINALSVSRIAQPKNDTKGSCYLSSVATLLAFKRGSGKTAGKDFSQSCAVYKEVYKKNDNTTYVYDSTLSYYGLKKQGYSLKNVYNSLKAGKPAVIYSGKHASLVVAYKGNKATELKASDFVVMEINALWKNSSSLFNSYANKGEDPYKWDSCYMTLDKWSSYTYNGKTNGTPTVMVTY